jgi:hypothetical protein
MKIVNTIAFAAALLMTAASVATVTSPIAYVPAAAGPVTSINGIHVTNLSTVFVSARITTLAPIVVTADASL